MESNMVDNDTCYMYPQDCVAFVVDYFKRNLPLYDLGKHGDYAGYWWVEFSHDVVDIKFEGDINDVFYVDINIDGTVYPLWSYEHSVMKNVTTNKKNLSYVLNVVKDFLS